MLPRAMMSLETSHGPEPCGTLSGICGIVLRVIYTIVSRVLFSL